MGEQPRRRDRPDIPDADKSRIEGVVYEFGRQGIGWGDVLNVWIMENQMRAQRKASSRVATATWGLVAVMALLFLGTLVLAWATVQSK